jgi:hypothetical protein
MAGMGLFSRGAQPPASRFPADMLRRLERFGRYEANPQGSGIDYMELADQVLAPYVSPANADPQGFFADLQAVVANDRDGYATFGAARLVWELLTGDAKRTPPSPAVALVKAGIEFKRAHGLGISFWETDIARLP